MMDISNTNRHHDYPYADDDIPISNIPTVDHISNHHSHSHHTRPLV